MKTANSVEYAPPIHIVVVDDDVVMLALLEASLEAHWGDGACVECTSDPKIASQKLDGGLIDVLITDLEMPGISGVQLLRHAKRRNAWTQVIVITAHSGTDALTEAMDSGASDYLVKPLDVAELDTILLETSSRLRRWRRSLAQTLVGSLRR